MRIRGNFASAVYTRTHHWCSPRVALPARLLRHVRRAATAGLLIATAGCASIPRSDVVPARFPDLSCEALARELTRAQESRAAADQARRRAWRVVLPVLAAGRYAHAASAKREATERIAAIEEQNRLKGCSPPAPPRSEPIS